jgi:hypothetical protein
MSESAALTGAAAVALALLIGAAVSVQRTGLSGLRRRATFRRVALLLALVLAFPSTFVGCGPNDSGRGRAGAPTGTDPVVQRHEAFEQLRASIVGGSVGSGPAASPRPGSLEPARLQSLLDGLAAFQRLLPRETFDPRAVLARTGRDPDALFAWVRDNTFLVPYRGELRGATGVLMDRRGNSLDRALLLAELLRLAGHGARLARAALTPEQTRTLLARARPIPPTDPGTLTPPEEWAGQDTQALDDHARQFKATPEPLAEQVSRLRQADAAALSDSRAQVATHAKQLRAALGAPVRVSTGADPGDERSDHWWVQYDRGGQWIDLDPTSGDAAAGESVTSATVTLAPGQIAEKDRWSVDLRVVAERWADGRLSEVPVLARKIHPWDLLDGDVTLTHVPLKWPQALLLGPDSAGPLESALKGIDTWVPVLTIGRQRFFESGIREDGRIDSRPMAVALPSPGGLFAGLLGGGEEAVASTGGVLTAEWIDYEVYAPGSPPRRLRRESFDLLGPAARTLGTVPAPTVSDAGRLRRGLALLGRTAVLIQAARPSPAFLADRAMRRFAEHKATILGAAGRDAAAAGKAARTALAQLFPLSDALWAYASTRFRMSRAAPDVYLDAPGIATIRESLVIGGDRRVVRRLEFDIVSNDVAVRPGAADTAFAMRMEQGVADTIAEKLILASPARNGNTADLFDAAGSQGIASVVARRAATDWKGAALLPPDTFARARQDLARRYDLVVPARPVTLGGSPRSGWWRVDPETGMTVGVMDTGLHSGLTEYVSLLMEKLDDMIVFGVASGPIGFFYDHPWIGCAFECLLGVASVIAMYLLGAFPK